MAISKQVILPLLLLLVSASGRAQGRAEAKPAATQQQMTVSITLPTVVAQLSDYAQAIFARNKGQRRTLTGKGSRTSNPVVEFTVDLPKGWGSRKGETGDEKK